MEGFVGVIFRLIARDRFTEEFIAIKDSSIKQKVEERLLGLDIFPLSIVIRPELICLINTTHKVIIYINKLGD